MGRPRRHGDETGRALLDAAESIVERDGPQALSVRRVADAVGTTTRAVYTVFGSKEALLVALGARAFELLAAAVDTVPGTGNPVGDLVAAGAVAFREFALRHPALFRIGVQRLAVSPEVFAGFSGEASFALAGLHARISRLGDVGLGGRSPADAACEFHALCEGLAALELRRVVPAERGDELWADALRSLVTGWRANRCRTSTVPDRR
jgi:AcrR family transcriptional regulator